MISLARLCSNLPESLSGPDDFHISILSSNMKTPFSEICRGLIFWNLVPGNWGNVFPDWEVKTDLNCYFYFVLLPLGPELW